MQSVRFRNLRCGLLGLLILLGGCANPPAGAPLAAHGELDRAWRKANRRVRGLTDAQRAEFSHDVATASALLDLERRPRGALLALPDALRSESPFVRDLGYAAMVRLDALHLVPDLVSSAIAHRPARPAGAARPDHYLPASIAIAALSVFGTRADSQLPRLLVVLEGDGPWLTPWLVPALVALDPRGTRVRPALARAAEHPDPFVRAAGLSALQTLGGG